MPPRSWDTAPAPTSPETRRDRPLSLPRPRVYAPSMVILSLHGHLYGISFRASTSSVRAVGPGRDEQGDVVVGVGVGYAEPDRDAPEERRLRQVRAPGEVPGDVEDDLVHADAELPLPEQGRVRPAIPVCPERLQQAPLVVIERVQLQRHAGGGPAVGGVEDVGGQPAAHGRRSTQPSIWP